MSHESQGQGNAAEFGGRRAYVSRTQNAAPYAVEGLKTCIDPVFYSANDDVSTFYDLDDQTGSVTMRRIGTVYEQGDCQPGQQFMTDYELAFTDDPEVGRSYDMTICSVVKGLKTTTLSKRTYTIDFDRDQRSFAAIVTEPTACIDATGHDVAANGTELRPMTPYHFMELFNALDVLHRQDYS